MRNPQSGVKPDWGFLVIILSRLPHEPKLAEKADLQGPVP